MGERGSGGGVVRERGVFFRRRGSRLRIFSRHKSIVQNARSSPFLARSAPALSLSISFSLASRPARESVVSSLRARTESTSRTN